METSCAEVTITLTSNESAKIEDRIGALEKELASLRSIGTIYGKRLIERLSTLRYDMQLRDAFPNDLDDIAKDIGRYVEAVGKFPGEPYEIELIMLHLYMTNQELQSQTPEKFHEATHREIEDLGMHLLFHLRHMRSVSSEDKRSAAQSIVWTCESDSPWTQWAKNLLTASQKP